MIGALLAIEKLHYAHAADVFLREAVDAGDGRADPAIALAHAVSEQARHDEDQRQNRECKQRQPPVDAQHHDGHDREREEIIDDSQDAAGEHFVDGIDVGGDACDQATHRVIVKEPDVHALHVAEDVAAQIEHDLLPGPLHQVSLNELKQVGGNQCTKVNERKPRDALDRIAMADSA